MGNVTLGKLLMDLMVDTIIREKELKECITITNLGKSIIEVIINIY